MQKARDDFEKRRHEIEKYFLFLQNAGKDQPILQFEEMGRSSLYRIDDELLKILKANGFLLLYNLVESITRLALSEYLFAINDTRTPFKKLKIEIQKLWIKNRKFQEQNPGGISEEEYLYKVHNEIIDNEIMAFELELRNTDGKIVKEFIEFSGNIDLKKIESVVEKYGIVLETSEIIKKSGSKCLYEVKNKRNDLAHGRISFADCTKNITVRQLCDYKDGALNFLESMLIDIENHILLNKYII